VRGFVALEAPEEVRALLGRVQEALRRSDADVRWVGPDRLHLTLKFLGEISEGQAQELEVLLRAEAQRWPPLSLVYAGVGAFPDHGVPRVVWAGVTGEIGKLSGLAAAIERAAEHVGVPREGRPFVAHVTLGRVRSGRNARGLQAAIEEQRQVPLGTSFVREIVLFRSTLTPEGPVYDARARIPLGGEPPGPPPPAVPEGRPL
jgi:2'-5' RNA ligase